MNQAKSRRRRAPYSEETPRVKVLGREGHNLSELERGKEGLVMEYGKRYLRSGGGADGLGSVGQVFI